MSAPGLRLAGDAADAYLRLLRRLLRVARTGAHYPAAARLDAHLGLMGPRGSFGVYDEVRLEPRSGLPSVAQLLEVSADREVAGSERREGAAPLPQRRAYVEALLAAQPMTASSVDVRLRRREGGASHLEIVHDRLDAASGCPVRYTVRVAHRGAAVRVNEADVAEPSRRFVTLIERNAGADAELAFLLLSELPGTTVEEVVRGQVGPLSMNGLEVPPLLEPVVREVPGAMILHLAHERAGIEVSEDRCRDPLGRLYRDALSEESRALVEARRAELGYAVAKERRLVCTPGAEGALRAALEEDGTRLVVRSR